MRRLTPEGAVKATICEFLDLRRIRYHRLNSGAMRGETNGRTWVVRMAKAGTADLLALPACKHGVMPLYIECKRANGGVQSRAQKEFQAEVEAQGFSYLLANSVDVVRDWLKGNR